MLRKLLTLLTVVGLSGTVWAQSGTLSGTVSDGQTGETIPTANVVIKSGEEIVNGTATDFDGNYTIKPITPGTYRVEISYIGYATKTINGVIITANKITTLDAELQTEANLLGEVDVVEYVVPLIDPDKGSGKTVTNDDIKAIPQRDVASIASQTAGAVQADDGDAVNIRGSRSGGTDTYIDGIKVRGSSSIPQASIDQMTVITGGLPAQYGDATGGIIAITTRGPSSEFFGGAEILSSQLTNDYNYNLFAANISGPLVTKEIDGRKTTTLGYFIAGEIESVEDPDPSAIGVWKVKDDKLEELRNDPLRPSTIGQGFVRNSEFVTFDDLEQVNAKLNTQRNTFRLSGKFDFKPSKTTNFTLGGNWLYRDRDAYVYTYSLFNFENNPQVIDNDWRVFGRFQQSFKNAEVKEGETATGLKNAFYTVQVDYSKSITIQQDRDNADNFFDYGYLGEFNTHRRRVYVPRTDSVMVNGQMLPFNGVEMVGFQDTLVEFTPGGVNPATEAYTEDYFGTVGTDRNPGLNENLFNIQQNGGLRNGDRPTDVYSLWFNTGRQWNGYQVNDNTQTRITAMGSADAGKHAIQVGMEFEQRDDRLYAVSAVPLWTIARQLTNLHLTQLDSNMQITFNNNGDTINYDRLYDAESQSYFDKNLRAKLGMDVTGTEFIDIDSYDPSTFSMDMFSADELLNDGNSFVAYYGYDHKGDKLEGNPSLDDFFNEQNDDGEYTRPINSFQPIYVAGYIQDKFNFRDLLFNVGVRVDRFDANQPVLKDPYSLFETRSAGEVTGLGDIPANIGEDYVVYVNSNQNPTAITGFRDGDIWYDAAGNEVSDPDLLKGDDGNVTPFLQDADAELSSAGFTDYKPQINVMPRISFSFPISDEAQFFAHYDVLTQRPTTASRFDPTDYMFITNQGGVLNNPNLRPERTIDYEFGFRQRLSQTSAITMSAFYRELRDMIQAANVLFAYPIQYTTYANIDFGTVKGLSVAYDMRRTGNVSLNASYTLQFADGSGSSATSGLSLINTGQPNLRVILPLDYDQRHTINGSVDYRFFSGSDYNGPVIGNKRILENSGMNVRVTAASGRPYSRQSNVLQMGAFGINQRPVLKGTTNGSRLPWIFRMDVKFDKNFTIVLKEDENGKQKTLGLNAYVQVQNLLNAQNVQSVYRFTGNPDDDGYLTSAVAQEEISSKTDPQAFIDLYSIKINNPNNYAIPRRVRLGLQLNF